MIRACCTRPRPPGLASACCPSSCVGRGWPPGGSSCCCPIGSCRRSCRCTRCTLPRRAPTAASSASSIFWRPTWSRRWRRSETKGWQMYRAPLKDLSFVLNTLLGPQPLAGCPAHTEYSADLADSVLTESARFAEEVLDPINRNGDQEGAHWSEQGVRSARGFREAYQQFIAGGWAQLRAPAEIGGQGMPLLLATAAQET